ncbi:MAG: DinB family protein [Deltaproteobacteria bacterium]|nr:DinB family protein [Deltaproteobacteria bacterium]
MSQALIAGPRTAFEHAYGLMIQFIEVCPEDIWLESFGGWPIWQQVYHALGLQFLTLQEGETPEPDLCPPEVGSFKRTPDKAPAKKDVLDYAARMKAKADAYINALRGADLSGVNQGLTNRMKDYNGGEFSHSLTLSMLSGHLLYHLGACDAALRQRGRKGVF